jgi:hypothetical protein
LTGLKQQLRDRQLAATVRARWHRHERGGAVYLLRIGALCKIGISLDPELRFNETQLPQAPDEARVFRLASYSAARELERALHEQYAARREHGEWFRLSAEDIEAIAAQCSARVGA